MKAIINIISIGESCIVLLDGETKPANMSLADLREQLNKQLSKAEPTKSNEQLMKERIAMMFFGSDADRYTRIAISKYRKLELSKIEGCSIDQLLYICLKDVLFSLELS